MRKIMGLVLAAALACAPLCAMAENDNVEIAFKIGDSVLSINGNAVEVEKPYVAGEGTTLVPLRVISEAFGAEVGWEGETKTITVDYSGKSIVLQIDNKEVLVDGQADELLEAPQLTENGYTMVPLRFISETFGAEVGWDDATKAVTVSIRAEEITPTAEPVQTAEPEDANDNTESTIPDAIFNPDASQLSDEDVADIKAQYGTIRYNFEQSVLPQAVFSEDRTIEITDADAFNYMIYVAWINTTDTYVVNTIMESEHEYVINSDDEVSDFLTNASIQTGLTLKENIERIDYLDGDNGDKIAIITMADCDEMLISKYIGIKRDKDGNYRVFTLENSFGGIYMFCEITKDDRGSITTLNQDYDAFVEAVKTGGERTAITSVDGDQVTITMR